jgi:hypothetical protein
MAKDSEQTHGIVEPKNNSQYPIIPPPQKKRNTMGNLPSLIQASQLAFMLLLKRDTLSLSRIPNMIQYPQEMRFTFSGRST